MSSAVLSGHTAARNSAVLRPYPADLPGVTVEWLALANSCSVRSIRRRRVSPPPDDADAANLLANMTPQLAREMALLRPSRGVLPFWSRLAIAEMAAAGATYSNLMHIFKVSRSTVYRAIHRPTAAYCSFSGRRLLTIAQAAPVNCS